MIDHGDRDAQLVPALLLEDLARPSTTSKSETIRPQFHLAVDDVATFKVNEEL